LIILSIQKPEATLEKYRDPFLMKSHHQFIFEKLPKIEIIMGITNEWVDFFTRIFRENC